MFARLFNRLSTGSAQNATRRGGESGTLLSARCRAGRSVLAGPKLATLLIAGGLSGGVGIFAFLGFEISAGKTQVFDRTMLLAMRRPDNHAPLGSARLQETARDISALGSALVLSLLTGAVAGCLALEGRKRLALLLCGWIATGILLETILKDIFDRPRPDIVPHATYVSGASFPSGHAMMSAIVYLSLAASFARFHRRKVIKAYSLILAAFLTILIGLTRVYLGVHWPTDVLAGWDAGVVWALLCWLAANAVLHDRA